MFSEQHRKSHLLRMLLNSNVPLRSAPFSAFLAGLRGIDSFNPLAYTDVSETAGLASSINTQPAVRCNSETNSTSQHNRGMY